MCELDRPCTLDNFVPRTGFRDHKHACEGPTVIRPDSTLQSIVSRMLQHHCTSVYRENGLERLQRKHQPDLELSRRVYLPRCRLHVYLVAHLLKQNGRQRHAIVWLHFLRFLEGIERCLDQGLSCAVPDRCYVVGTSGRGTVFHFAAEQEVRQKAKRNQRSTHSKIRGGAKYDESIICCLR